MIFYFFQLIILVLLLTFFRGLFLAVYYSSFKGLSLFQIFSAFFKGVHFDIASAAMVLFPSIVLLLVSSFINKKIFKFLYKLQFIFSLSMVIIFSCSDIIYFSNANKRLGYEAYVYFSHGITSIIQIGIIDSPILFLVCFGLLISMAVLIFKTKKNHFVPNKQTNKNYLYFLLLIIFTVVAIRGGFQNHRLKISDSIISSNNFLNSLVVSTPFQVIRSMGIGRYTINFDEKLMQAVREDLNSKYNMNLSKDYLFTKSIENNKIINKKNIALILLESWDSVRVGPKSKFPEATPFFNSLAKKGYYFPNFYSCGIRSSNGLFCSLSGVYDVIGKPMMWRKELTHSFPYISRILKDHGYTNLFFTGGTLMFDNLKRMLITSEFDYSAGQDEISKIYNHSGNSWGIEDEYIYKHAIEKIKKTKGPWFSYFLTASSHSPFLVDKKYHKFSKKDFSDFDLLNSLVYSDKALENFVNDLKKIGQYENTIFIITADHTNHKGLSFYHDKSIPFVIYSPINDLPRVSNDYLSNVIGSQVDIQPTIMSLLGLKIRNTFGFNLFDKKDSYAIWVSGKQVGMHRKDFMYTYSEKGQFFCYHKNKQIDCGDEHKSSLDLLLGLYSINLKLIIENKF